MWSLWNLESSNASVTKGHLGLLPGCLPEIPLEVGHKGRQVWVDYIILCKPSGLVLSAEAARSGSAWPAVFRRDFAVSWQKRRVCMGLWGCRDGSWLCQRARRGIRPAVIMAKERGRSPLRLRQGRCAPPSSMHTRPFCYACPDFRSEVASLSRPLCRMCSFTASQMRRMPSWSIARGHARLSRMNPSEFCTNMLPPSRSTPAL